MSISTSLKLDQITFLCERGELMWGTFGQVDKIEMSSVSRA